MSEKSKYIKEMFHSGLLFGVSVSLFVQSRGCSNVLTESLFSADMPQHYQEQFMDSKIIKIEQDGIPPLVKIHILSKSGCTYVIAPAGRTISLENPEDVDADSKCLKQSTNEK